MEILNFFAVIFTTATLMAEGLSLTIDNQLVIIANDCYTRIAIGSILPSKDISASVIAVTVTECEDECSRKRNTCEIFSFGISSKGNASCLLGTRIPNAEELESNSDYDIYIRQQSSPHCMPDRLYKLGSGSRNPTNYNNNGSKEYENDGPRVPKPEKRPSGDFATVANPNLEKYPIEIGNRPNHHENHHGYKNPNGENHPIEIGNRPNYQNYNGYQISEQVSPNFPSGYHPHPGNPTFHDEDNPNPPSNYANKNSYGGGVQTGYGGGLGHHKPQGNPNFNIGYGPDGSADFYPGESHEIGGGNRGDYYPHDSGNRYGIHIYEAPDTVCKLKPHF